MKHINKKNGRYLEVGAFDGLVGSVTLRLQNIWGWKGVLIEPIKFRFEKLSKFRGKKNICIHSACTDNENNKELELINLGRMSFIDSKKEKISINKNKHVKIAQELMIGKVLIETVPNNTLTNILTKRNIYNLDLAIIDVEGSEHLLLNGLDLKKINIDFICIETYNLKQTKLILKKYKYYLIDKLSKHDYLFKKKNKVIIFGADSDLAKSINTYFQKKYDLIGFSKIKSNKKIFNLRCNFKNKKDIFEKTKKIISKNNYISSIIILLGQFDKSQENYDKDVSDDFLITKNILEIITKKIVKQNL